MPLVVVRVAVDVIVKKVTVLGHREPEWSAGFTIDYGLLYRLDDKGAVLASLKNEGRHQPADVGFALKTPVARVRTVPFTSLLDDSDKTKFKDIALAEILVEERRQRLAPRTLTPATAIRSRSR